MYKNANKQRSYKTKWYHEQREEYFKNKECKWCGSTVELVIHHVNPETKTSHKIWSWSEDRRNKELNKCVVLCDKCHRLYHTPPTPLVHGTRNAYHEKRCRCALCRQWRHENYIDYKNRKSYCPAQ